MDKLDKVDTREAQICLVQKNLETAKLTETKLKGFKLLSQIKMTETLLRKTGIGRTIQAMAYAEDEVGEAAFDLVHKWRIMVAEGYMRREHLRGSDEEECIKRKQESSSSDEENMAHQSKKIKCITNTVKEKTRKLPSEASSSETTKAVLKEPAPKKLKHIDFNKSPAPLLPNRKASPERNTSKRSKKLPIAKSSSESSTTMQCPAKSQVVSQPPAANKSHTPRSIKTPIKDDTKSTIKEVKMNSSSAVTKSSSSSKPQSAETKPVNKEMKMKAADLKSKENVKPKKSAPIMTKLLRAFKGHR